MRPELRGQATGWDVGRGARAGARGALGGLGKALVALA
jgi:hypothetical protein